MIRVKHCGSLPVGIEEKDVQDAAVIGNLYLDLDDDLYLAIRNMNNDERIEFLLMKDGRPLLNFGVSYPIRLAPADVVIEITQGD